MSLKRFTLITLMLVALTVALVACGGDETPEEVPTEAVSEAPETDTEETEAEVEETEEMTEEESQEAQEQVTGSIMDRVQSRGRLVCGARTDLAGFGYLDDQGNNIGFDIDLCRAVAAAIFNDPDAVEIVPLTAADRGPSIQTGEVDMLSRNVTWTSSRDAQWGNFTITMFYDGQGFIVPADSGIETLEELDGATVCVTSGTTTELNLADAFRQRGLDFTADAYEDTATVYSTYEGGGCDAATSDKSQLAAIQSGLEDPDAHRILDITISKEPLTPAVPHGDDQWFDVVKTVLMVLINAEELGISSDNVDDMMSSENIEVLRLLGQEGEFGQSDLGLDQEFAANVIRAVGNYGEIYDRYMGPDGDAFSLDRGLNRLWTDGGILYAPPLR
ncbi:MAG TPA: amino acid ABC transporter substrate-binding protein [Candidatus Sulfomarinibacteraceae bacterium]|nr:amino acid ABC transporter substrate-binding protein [Candidatus Sulfomarinibacteraceae bacterium]